MRDIVPASAIDGWSPFARLLDDDGSPGQPGFARLGAPRAPLRDLADAIHCLCLLYGHRPGALEIASEHVGEGRDPVESAAAAFIDERGWLSRLISAVGPLPSTPHQTASETAIATQRHAIELLAGSDRQGCALGTACALIVDWRAMRPTLDAIGERLGLEAPPCTLPDEGQVHALIAGTTPAAARGVRFGAEQLLAQHRGLWALVDARASARAG